MRWLAVVPALLLAAPAAAQEPPAWVGLWDGMVGTYPVRLCMAVRGDQPARGSYYYLSQLEPIALTEEDGEGGWVELGADFEPRAVWSFSEQTGTRLRGTWRQGTRSLPFDLKPVAWSENEWGGPCVSAAFSQPRWGGGRTVSEQARVAGLSYTRHVYTPPAHFAGDLALESFSIKPEQLGDPAINQTLAALVPMPGDTIDEEIMQCMAYAIAANGVDGSFEQSIIPKMAVGPFLTVEISSGDYCGGAHPNHDLYHVTYDRTTGAEVDIDGWFGSPDANGGVVTPPELRAAAMAKWPASEDLAECREYAAEVAYWNLELTRDGISFTPSFPHALKACEEPALLTWSELAPFLDAEGRAGLARLRE
jgi:hypothetical protein